MWTTKKTINYVVEIKEYSDEGRVKPLERQTDRKTDTQTHRHTAR